MKLHHYTTIETLALILDSSKIRFNRLTNVDDIQEAELYGKYSVAPFLYVSCWTTSEVENIPLWTMYTANMKGVRITFEDKPFFYQKLDKPLHFVQGHTGDMYSPLTYDQICNEQCFVIPNFLDKSKFGGEMQYVPDVTDYYKEAAKLTFNPDGTANVELKSANDLAIHKNEYWKFQEEYRFSLLAFPAPPTGYDQSAWDNMHHHSVNSIYHGVCPDNEFIDVDICPTLLRSIIVTLGPLTTFSEEVMVRSLIEKYCPEAKVEYSSLKGMIRTK